MKTIVQILLALLIIFLAYHAYRSIKTPLEYKKIKKERSAEIIQRLKDIRTAEKAFRQTNKKFTTDLDSLIDFMQNGYVPEIKAEGQLTDDQLEKGITEKEAVKRGLIKRDTMKVPVKDKFFSHISDFKNMKYIPHTKEPFQIAEAQVAPTASATIKVQVIEVKAPLNIALKDIVEDYEEPYGTDLSEYERLSQYPGWKIGSLEESNDLAGNWE